MESNSQKGKNKWYCVKKASIVHTNLHIQLHDTFEIEIIPLKLNAKAQNLKIVIR